MANASVQSTPVAAPPPLRATDFIGAIGVNTHLGQNGESATKIIADMAYLGLGKIRNHAIGPNTPATQVKSFGVLADAGLKFDWLTGGPLGPSLTALDAFLKAHPGSIAAIEGPNEVNNFPIAYGGLIGAAAAQAYQKALYAAVKADRLAASIPVLDFTGATDPAGAADAANAHPYPKGGDQPLATLTAAENRLAMTAPGKPVYFTEAGYFTLPGQHGWEGVDEKTQAKLTLNLILDAAKLGVRATYLYDLADDGADPTGTIATDHFGLFTTTGQAKPSATAIHNLSSILADPGGAAGSFIPTALNYTVSGLPTSGASLVIEKSSGVYDIAIWAEPDIWNAVTHTPITAPAQSVTLHFAAAAQISVFDPLLSASPTQTASAASSVTIALSDHPLIVQVSGFAQAMAGFSAAANVAANGPGVAASPHTGLSVLAPASGARTH